MGFLPGQNEITALLRLQRMDFKLEMLAGRWHKRCR